MKISNRCSICDKTSDSSLSNNYLPEYGSEDYFVIDPKDASQTLCGDCAKGVTEILWEFREKDDDYGFNSPLHGNIDLNKRDKEK